MKLKAFAKIMNHKYFPSHRLTWNVLKDETGSGVWLDDCCSKISGLLALDHFLLGVSSLLVFLIMNPFSSTSSCRPTVVIVVTDTVAVIAAAAPPQLDGSCSSSMRLYFVVSDGCVVGYCWREKRFVLFGFIFHYYFISRCGFAVDPTAVQSLVLASVTGCQ